MIRAGYQARFPSGSFATLLRVNGTSMPVGFAQEEVARFW